jgi:hypothetical protein
LTLQLPFPGPDRARRTSQQPAFPQNSIGTMVLDYSPDPTAFLHLFHNVNTCKSATLLTLVAE